MRKYKPIIAFVLVVSAITFFTNDVSAQKWKRSKPETLYARNKRKNLTPIYVGIGTRDPTAQFHTTGSVRFQGITVNNNLNSVLAIDGNGNLFWRDISNTITNAWFLNGNTITSAAFLGTTNNEDVRIRTNNIQRAVITSAGLVGIGVASPTAQLHTNGSVRFEGITNDDGIDRIIVTDNYGNLFWRNAASIAGASWLLAGNNANSSSFLGTTNTEDLRFRTNNIQRAVLTATGSLGLGISTPSAQLHTNGTVRLEGISNNNSLQRLALFDNSGNLFYRDLSSLQSNFWSLTGNTGTNPVSNFLGTVDNNRLVFRTNNTERMTILGTNGYVGLGVASPPVRLYVSNSEGAMTGFPYEIAVLENSGDTKLTIVSSDNTAVGGAAVVLGHSNFTVGGFYPAYEMQYGINNGRYLRFNYLLRTTNGIIQSAVPNIMILSDNSRVGINLGPPDGALTPNYPTANLHTNGTVRFQGLPNGTGNPLVVDVNGNVFVGSTPTSNAWNLTGNSGTNPANNFLGTTDNNRLVFRTNNTEKVTILANGNTGFGLSVPASPVHVFSATDDNQLFLSGSAPSTRFFQGQDWNASAFHARVGLATGNANYVSTSVPGDFVVQVLDNGSLLFGTNGAGANGLERMRISSIGYIGIATTNPTAKLHVNCVAVPGQPNPSNIRFENLPTGTGFALVMDANGYVFKSSSLVGRNEVNELKDEIIGLKEELQMLQNVVNSMKDGYFILKNSKEGAFLYQNNPNPFYQETTIRYFLPAGSSNAILQINDVLGTTIKTYLLDSEGRQSITIDGGALSAGTYFYTLIINGKKADTKKMILTK